MEGLWALKAIEHMQIYFNLISSIDPKILRLTPKDDLVYEQFKESFPDLEVAVIDVEAMKSDKGKEKWRYFCNKFETEVEDFNYGTMLRVDAAGDYIEENSIVVPRIQFLAIEITRNREGHNDGIRSCFGKLASGKKKAPSKEESEQSA